MTQHYDNNQIVLDFQRTGSDLVQAGDLQWRYLWGPAVDQILAEEAVDNGADGTVQWTLTDHLNTVRDIAKYDPAMDSTSIVNHLLYDAFGQVTSESNPAVDSLFLFTARPFDSDTQLQNNLNRWYDPAVGRWLSEDPIQSDPNLYCYVSNNPLNWLDPIGEEVTGTVIFMPSWFVRWDQSMCPRTCDQSYGRDYENDVIADRAEGLKNAAGGNVEVVVRDRSCGGARGFSLTCDCRRIINDPNAPTVVCVKKQTTCKTLEVLEHEFVHAAQIANGRPIDSAAELEAYKTSCEMQAKHNCLKLKNCWSDRELSNWINQCAYRSVGGSLGPGNRAEIEKGCRTV